MLIMKNVAKLIKQSTEIFKSKWRKRLRNKISRMRLSKSGRVLTKEEKKSNHFKRKAGSGIARKIIFGDLKASIKYQIKTFKGFNLFHVSKKI